MKEENNNIITDTEIMDMTVESLNQPQSEWDMKMERLVDQTIADLETGKLKIDFQQLVQTDDGELMPKWTEVNGITYILEEENYLYIPLMSLPKQTEYELGMWGKERADYLRNEDKGTWELMKMEFTLQKHLIETEKAADRMEEKLMRQLMEVEGITEELKQKNQMEWVRRYNNLKHRVWEIIREELIYV